MWPPLLLLLLLIMTMMITMPLLIPSRVENSATATLYISVCVRATQSGVLKRSTYWEYIREAAGVWQVVLIFISMAGGQVGWENIL